MKTGYLFLRRLVNSTWWRPMGAFVGLALLLQVLQNTNSPPLSDNKSNQTGIGETVLGMQRTVPPPRMPNPPLRMTEPAVSAVPNVIVGDPQAASVLGLLKGEKTLGYLQADLPFKVDRDQPFNLDIWLTPSGNAFDEPVKVFMEQTTRVRYEPRVFTLKPHERKTIKARILSTHSGLLEVIASADRWESLVVPIDAGFSGKLKTNITGPIMSGATKSFSVGLTDNQGNSMPLDAPVKLHLSASKAKIRKQGEEWSESLDLDLAAGASSSPILEIRPQSWTSDTGVVFADVRLKNDLILLNDNIWISIIPGWWVCLLMAIAGGLLHSFYLMLKAFPESRGSFTKFLVSVSLIRLATGVLAGTFAYLLSEWGILGVKVDTTTLQGFVILGFLFAYVGIDFVLKTATLGRKGAVTGERDEGAPIGRDDREPAVQA